MPADRARSGILFSFYFVSYLFFPHTLRLFFFFSSPLRGSGCLREYGWIESGIRVYKNTLLFSNAAIDKSMVHCSFFFFCIIIPFPALLFPLKPASPRLVFSSRIYYIIDPSGKKGFVTTNDRFLPNPFFFTGHIPSPPTLPNSTFYVNRLYDSFLFFCNFFPLSSSKEQGGWFSRWGGGAVSLFSIIFGLSLPQVTSGIFFF